MPSPGQVVAVMLTVSSCGSSLAPARRPTAARFTTTDTITKKRGYSSCRTRRSATTDPEGEKPEDNGLESLKAWNAKSIDRLGEINLSGSSTEDEESEEAPLGSAASAAMARIDPGEQSARLEAQQRAFSQELNSLEAKAIAEIRERTAPITAKLTDGQRKVASAADKLVSAQTEMKAFENQAKLFTLFQLSSALMLSVAAFIKFT